MDQIHPAYILLVCFIIPISLFISVKPFIQHVIIQLFWIGIVESIISPKGFPRVGNEADTIKDVSDPKWLTEALTVKYPGTKVSAASAKSFGSDMGNASTMYRLSL